MYLKTMKQIKSYVPTIYQYETNGKSCEIIIFSMPFIKLELPPFSCNFEFAHKIKPTLKKNKTMYAEERNYHIYIHVYTKTNTSFSAWKKMIFLIT